MQKTLLSLIIAASAITAGAAEPAPGVRGLPGRVTESQTAAFRDAARSNPGFKFIEPKLETPSDTEKAMRAPDDGREYRTILDEGFDKLTSGTAEEPDMTSLINTSSGYVDPKWTEMPGWEGSGLRQAGGNILIDMVNHDFSDGTQYEYGGYLTTPSLDLSKDYGTTYISFRARSLGNEPAYLYITWTYPYEEGGQITSIVYDGWALYENFVLDNCPYNCQITIQSPSARVLIDWIKIEKFKPELEAPEVLKWKDYDDSGEYLHFTPRWTAVEGAEKYELHVYRYYDDGVTTKKVVKETKLTDTEFAITDKQKLDKQYTYYYYVIAKNSNYTSEESSRAMVFDVMTPEILGVENNTESGFLAKWTSVNNACGYGYFNSLTHTAENEEDYYAIRKDFDAASYPGVTMEDPHISIIGLDDMDELPMSRANWRLYEGAYIDGAIGMRNRMIGDELYNGQLVSPTMILGASDRKVTVTADFASPSGIHPIIFLYCPVPNPETGKSEWQVVDYKRIDEITPTFRTHTVELQATSSLCILNVSLDDMDGFFFMDNLEVSQHLLPGEYIALPYTYNETKRQEDTEYYDATPDRMPGDVYRFFVFAAREMPGSSWFPIYVTSEETEPFQVPDVEFSGLEGVRMNGNAPSLSISGRSVAAKTGTSIHSLDGSLTISMAPGEKRILAPGVYAARDAEGNAFKFIIK